VKKNFPLRIDAALFDQVRQWADDDLRSMNGQIEFLLREALRRSGRLKDATPAVTSNSNDFVKPTEVKQTEE
jgi:hypothetical protein